MSRDELSLLLFLETRAVDQAGGVATQHMNDDDMTIAKRWAKEGYIEFGRICAADVFKSSNKSTHWVRLSEQAWADAHAERRARAERMWEKKWYHTTQEIREEAS